MSHTKGPWQTSKDNRGAIPPHWQPYCVLGNDGTVVVARLPDGDSQTDRDNARLIAAAPDLLAALQECITDDNANCLVTSDVAYMIRRFKAINSLARAAIAKAESR